MKVRQHINKLFCTLLFFSAGNKSYSQREIHPLEPMFTYDYALKYYSNLHVIGRVPNYWSIENFKAPIGVKTIKNLYDYLYYPADRRFGNTRGEKVYHYNSDTGFLKEQLLLKITDKKEVADTLIIRSFTYHFDEDVTIIKSETKSSEYNGNTTYTFENQTGLLTKVTSSSTIFKDDNTQSTYSDTNEYHYITNNDIHLASINKIKLTTQTEDGKILQNERDYSVSQKKEPTPTEVDEDIYPEVENNYDFIELKIERIDSKEERINISISDKHIYYWLSHYEKGLVLFDENKRPIEHRLFKVIDRNVSFSNLNIVRGYLSDGFFMFLSKKTDKRWIANLYDKNKKRELRNKYQIKDRITKEKRKGYTIYYDSYPALIYKYY